MKKQISGVGNQTAEEISVFEVQKIKNTDSETLRKLSLNQAAILSTLQALSQSQNDDIKKLLFEEQQDKISFP